MMMYLLNDEHLGNLHDNLHKLDEVGTISDEIEREGMRRSAESFRSADVRVLVLDGSSLAVDDSLSVARLLQVLQG